MRVRMRVRMGRDIGRVSDRGSWSRFALSSVNNQAEWSNWPFWSG